MRRNNNFIAYISCLVVVVALVFAMLIEEVGAVISSLITTIITTFGAVVIWIQLRRTRIKVSNELMGNMNTVFLKSTGLVYLRDKLLRTSNPKDYSVDGKIGNKDTTRDLDNFIYDDSVNIIEYLEFFENIGEMYFAGTVTMVDMEKTFGQAFFAAMNNTYIQNREIIPYKEHYQTSIKLYRDWSEYRKKEDIKSPYEDTPLDWKNLLEDRKWENILM